MRPAGTLALRAITTGQRDLKVEAEACSGLGGRPAMWATAARCWLVANWLQAM